MKYLQKPTIVLLLLATNIIFSQSIYYEIDGEFNISTADDPLFTVQGTGNVGIGTSNPLYKLDVIGNINIPNDQAYQIDGMDFVKYISADKSILIGKNAGFEATTPNIVAVGEQAAYQSTGSNSLTAVGYWAGRGNTGESLTAIGYFAGRNHTGRYSTMVGKSSGMSSKATHATFLGLQSGYQSTSAYSTYIGFQAGRDAAGGSNVSIGYDSGKSNTGSAIVAVGRTAGYQNTGTHVAAVGVYAGNKNSGGYLSAIGAHSGSLNTGDRSSGLGYQTVYNNTADDVVAIGYQAGKDNTTANQFILQQANVNTTPLMQGDFSTGNVGIGTTAPTERLEVVGSVKIVDGTQGADKVLTSDADGVASWQPAGSGADNWGTQVAQTEGAITGDGDITPIKIIDGATADQVLKWNGTTWAPGTDAVGSGADDWGTQVAQTEGAITGDGSAATPLKLIGGATGQVLKWNGTTWVPGTDAVGSGSDGDAWNVEGEDITSAISRTGDVEVTGVVKGKQYITDINSTGTTWDFSESNIAKISINGVFNITINSAPSSGIGSTYILILKNDSSSGDFINISGRDIKYSNGTAPYITPESSTVLTFVDDGELLYCVAATNLR